MSWLDRYAEWAAAGGEATAEAHRWGGYALMAAALGREVSFALGHRNVNSGFYLMVVSRDRFAQAEEVARVSRRVALRVYAREFAHHATLEGFFEQMREPWGTLLCLNEDNWSHWSRGDYGALLSRGRSIRTSMSTGASATGFKSGVRVSRSWRTRSHRARKVFCATAG